MQPADLPSWAEQQATTLLADLGDRWAHVQGVAAQARWVSPAIADEDRPYLVAAAWLHDIGYAPTLAGTGLLALPGRPPLPPHRLRPPRQHPGALPLPGLRPQPIQARLFSHALVENDLGACINCGQPACKLLVGGTSQPDTSLCERCEYRRYLNATGGRDYANEQRIRWGLPPSPRPELR